MEPAIEDGLAPSQIRTHLYSTDDSPSLYSVPVDGTPQSFIASIGGDANRGLAFNVKTGILYGTGNGVFGSIDPLTGGFTPLASPPSETECLAADPNRNVVYGLETDIEDLMAYGVATNIWSIVGPTTVENGDKAGLAYDPDLDVIHAADRDGTGNLYSIDPVTAATTWIGITDVDSSFYGLAFVSAQIFTDDFESGDTSAWSLRYRRRLGSIRPHREDSAAIGTQRPYSAATSSGILLMSMMMPLSAPRRPMIAPTSWGLAAFVARTSIATASKKSPNFPSDVPTRRIASSSLAFQKPWRLCRGRRTKPPGPMVVVSSPVMKVTVPSLT